MEPKALALTTMAVNMFTMAKNSASIGDNTQNAAKTDGVIVEDVWGFFGDSVQTLMALALPRATITYGMMIRTFYF